MYYIARHLKNKTEYLLGVEIKGCAPDPEPNFSINLLTVSLDDGEVVDDIIDALLVFERIESAWSLLSTICHLGVPSAGFCVCGFD